MKKNGGFWKHILNSNSTQTFVVALYKQSIAQLYISLHLRVFCRLKKWNLTEHTLTNQHGSKQQVVCCISWRHVFTTTCLATFEKPTHRRKLGKISRKSSRLIRLHERFNSTKIWIMSNKGTCRSQAIPWRTRSCVTHSPQSMSTLMATRWCKYASMP